MFGSGSLTYYSGTFSTCRSPATQVSLSLFAAAIFFRPHPTMSVTNPINIPTPTAKCDSPKAAAVVPMSPSPTLNDNSNPQQGTGTRVACGANSDIDDDAKPPTVPSQRAPLKIPPTVKDVRKLFVGGLPSDGKFLFLFVLWTSESSRSRSSFHGSSMNEW
jgi:hypothetical protein